MKKNLRYLLMSISIVLTVPVLAGNGRQSSGDSLTSDSSRHSVDFCPLSPIIRIYTIQYNYRMTSKDELILGLAYMNIHYDFGNTNSPALIFGYRRFLWKNLHVEYQLWPCYDEFWEKNERKVYKSFDLWNEFRLGYQFNFNVASLPCYTTVQWPFGFGLYAGNKPESFMEHVKSNRFFCQVPLVFVGVRF